MSKVKHDPVEAALEKILAGDARPPDRGPTKCDLVDKYRDQLLTLKSKGWTWVDIARQLKDLGLSVSPKTIQRRLVEHGASPGKKTARSPAKRGTSAAPPERTQAGQTKAATSAQKTASAPAAKAAPATRSTETDFVTIKGDEL